MNWWTVNYEAAWDAAVGHKHAKRWPRELCLISFPLQVRLLLQRSRWAEATLTRIRFISLPFFPPFALPNFNYVNRDGVISNTNAAIRWSVVIIIGYLTAPTLEPVVAAVFVELLAWWRSLLFFRRLICISSKCLQATKWGGRSWRVFKHLADNPTPPSPSPPPPPLPSGQSLFFFAFFHPPLLPLIPLPALFSHSTVKAHP